MKKQSSTKNAAIAQPNSSLLTNDDLFLFNEGTHSQLYDKLGAHLTRMNGQDGVHFSVWAPNAERVSVIGDFNEWTKRKHPLQLRGNSGIFEGFVPDVKRGANYKYHIESREQGYCVNKADPFGIYAEVAPHTGSFVWDLDYTWQDQGWMQRRGQHNHRQAPISVYELHLGSWRRSPDEPERLLTYRELAEPLVKHMLKMGFTHLEFLPLTEHPFYGSWGYQTTGYFAATSRYGTPQDLMYLIDTLHQNGIGVLLDWVPSHFPNDEHGLGFFDGTHLFEHADPRKGFHPDWNSFIFNYGRTEVRSFLMSSALFWLDKFHFDGLRVDAVASMLYLDYSRKAGEWIPNVFGGRENLEAIDFLKQLNGEIYRRFPDVQTIAEESTAWPKVSRPVFDGGLGFGLKWDMGWMHDTLKYMQLDPIHRKHHQGALTFRMMYAFQENFVLPLSHDEVVHGKGSLYGKMAGDDWQKRAGLRLLYGYMFGMPGKKLLFMGAESGQLKEWNHDAGLDWELLRQPAHEGLRAWVEILNRTYVGETALHQLDCSPAGFEWIDCNDADRSVLSFLRKGETANDFLLIVCNFTPIPRENYRMGIPCGGYWREVLNSNAKEYGGTGQGNLGGLNALPLGHHDRPFSLTATLPPLSCVYFKPTPQRQVSTSG